MMARRQRQGDGSGRWQRGPGMHHCADRPWKPFSSFPTPIRGLRWLFSRSPLSQGSPLNDQTGSGTGRHKYRFPPGVCCFFLRRLPGSPGPPRTSPPRRSKIREGCLLQGKNPFEPRKGRRGPAALEGTGPEGFKVLADLDRVHFQDGPGKGRKSY